MVQLSELLPGRPKLPGKLRISSQIQILRLKHREVQTSLGLF